MERNPVTGELLLPENAGRGETLECPACGKRFQVVGSPPRDVACPYCGELKDRLEDA